MILFLRFDFQFGNSWPDIRYPDSQDTIEANTLLDEADNHFSSWTFWDSNILWSSNSERVLDVNIAKVLARPYPQATAGTPIKVTFLITFMKASQNFEEECNYWTNDLLYR